MTSAADEKGRDTVFDHLPDDMPRVMSVGRLDLNSEGLLLLTNDGELKRRLELPSTGWLRKYRVRVQRQPDRRPSSNPCARASPSTASGSSRCRSRWTAFRAPMPG